MKINRTAVIAGHEFRGITSTKAFVIITVIGPFLILAVSVLPGLIAQRADGAPSDARIGIAGMDTELIEVFQDSLKETGFTLVPGEDLEQMKQMMLDDELYGLLEIPGDLVQVQEFIYYSKTGTDASVFETLRAVLGNMAVTLRMEEAGLDSRQIRELSALPGISVRRLSRSGVEESRDMFSIIVTAVSFVMLLYMTILLYGQMIGRSIVIEKTSKTVEILLSSARAKEIMFGKILGIGAAGLLQYALWIAAGLLIILVIGPVLDISLPSGLNPVTLLFLLLFFLAAFLLYASVYAALGAAAEDEQNLGQLAWPLILFLVIPMIMISPIVMNPSSGFALVLSYFPLTAPVVMFTRVLVSMPKAWELLLCFAVLAASIALTVRAAAKVFRVGILMTGKRFTLKEIAVWVKHDK